MAALSIGIAGLRSHSSFTIPSRTTKLISCVWDPEGLFKGPPQAGYIDKLEFRKRIDKDDDSREAYQRQLLEDKYRRETLRQSRVVPDTAADLIEYLLDTEAQEIEFEIARLRPRLNEEFFKHLQSELGQLRFALNKTQAVEDRTFELQALHKALTEGTEAYDKMQNELVNAKLSLAKIFSSKDVKTTLINMVEGNELNRSLLALLDENIASAHQSNQAQAAEYMEKLRAAVVKYITV